VTSRILGTAVCFDLYDPPDQNAVARFMDEEVAQQVTSYLEGVPREE